MLRLSDFVTCRKGYYNQSSWVCISAFKLCRKMKFRTYLHLTLISRINYVVTDECGFCCLKSVCTVEMTM